MYSLWMVTCDGMPTCFLKARTGIEAQEIFIRSGTVRFVEHESFTIRPVTLALLMEELPDEFQIIPDLIF